MKICMPIRRAALFCLLALLAALSPMPARAHSAPSSFADLRLGAAGMEVSLQASATDLSHGLPAVEPEMLMTLPSPRGRDPHWPPPCCRVLRSRQMARG